MTYIKVDDDTWIKYDGVSSSVVKKSVLLQQKEALEFVVAQIRDISDADLLEIARREYRINERMDAESKINIINSTIERLV